MNHKDFEVLSACEGEGTWLRCEPSCFEHTWSHSGGACNVCAPYVAETQLGEIGQLLDLDDGVVQRRLKTLRYHVGQDDGDHHGKDVRDLTGQLKADHCRGNGVSDGPCQRRRTLREKDRPVE